MEQYIKIKGNVKARLSQVIPFLGLIIIVMFFQFVTSGQLLTVKNGIVIFNQMFSIILGATCGAFLMAQGNFDFSIGPTAGVAGALAAKAAGVNPFLALPVALLVGALIGAINGFNIGILKIGSIVGTLAVSYILKSLIIQILESGSIAIPISMLKIDNILIKLAVFFVVVGGCFILFEYSKLGKQSKAVGSQVEAARQSGVNIRKIKIMVFVLTGLISGLIGFFSIIRAGSVSTTTGAGLSVNVILALFVGGVQLTSGTNLKFRNVLIGSLIMAILTNGMTLWGIDTLIQQLVKGVIFVIAVTLTLDRQSLSVIN